MASRSSAGMAANGQKPGYCHQKPALNRLKTSFRNPLLDIVWTGLMTKPRELEELRHVSDTLADDCIQALHVKAGTDALQALDEYISRPLAEQDLEGPILKFKEQVGAVPEWVDWGLVQQGQEFFWKYCIPIVIILTNYSLVHGFASSKQTDILSCTNYFSTPGGTYQRMLETCKFVLDSMKSADALRPFKGVGWSSIVRVRMLHTQVRLRIVAQAKLRPDLYSIEEMGVPINQEDLLGTLCEFSIVVVCNLRKLGMKVSPDEVTAYLHLWHLIGYYLGITGELSTHLVSEEGASALFESIGNHVIDPHEGSAKIAHTLLESVAFTAPLFWPYGLHCAVSRILVGDKISDALLFEPTPWYWKIVADMVLFVTRLIHASTLFLHTRLWFYRTVIPSLYDAVVRRWVFEDPQHHKIHKEHCDFTLKYIPHLAEDQKSNLRQ